MSDAEKTAIIAACNTLDARVVVLQVAISDVKLSVDALKSLLAPQVNPTANG